jgi:hypothetical protein
MTQHYSSTKTRALTPAADVGGDMVEDGDVEGDGAEEEVEEEVGSKHLGRRSEVRRMECGLCRRR